MKVFKITFPLKVYNENTKVNEDKKQRMYIEPNITTFLNCLKLFKLIRSFNEFDIRELSG